MRRAWKFVTASRKRKVFALISAFALTSATTALAAFFLFQGLTGTSNGTFATATISPAITVSGTAPQIQGPNDVQAFDVTIHNNDTVQHTLTALTPTFSSPGAGCAAQLGFIYGTSNPQLPRAIAGGADFVLIGSTTNGSRVTSTASLPQTCQASTYSIAWSGTETKP